MPYSDMDDDILRSLQGLQRPEPSPYLYAQVRHRLEARQEPVVRVSLGWALRLAVLVGGLLAADLLVWTQWQEKAQAPAATAYAYPAESYVF